MKKKSKGHQSFQSEYPEIYEELEETEAERKWKIHRETEIRKARIDKMFRQRDAYDMAVDLRATEG